MEKKGFRLFTMILAAVLLLSNIAAQIITIINFSDMKVPDGNVNPIHLAILFLLIDVIIIAYCVGGYKIPHGNAMKFAFLLFSALIGWFIIQMTDILSSLLPAYLMLSAVILTAFVGGRLNKIERNRIIILLCIILLVVSGVLTYIDHDENPVPNNSEPLIEAAADGEMYEPVESSSLSKLAQDCNAIAGPAAILLALGIAYDINYEAHKKAGEEADTE